MKHVHFSQPTTKPPGTLSVPGAAKLAKPAAAAPAAPPPVVAPPAAKAPPRPKKSTAAAIIGLLALHLAFSAFGASTTNPPGTLPVPGGSGTTNAPGTGGSSTPTSTPLTFQLISTNLLPVDGKGTNFLGSNFVAGSGVTITKTNRGRLIISATSVNTNLLAFKTNGTFVSPSGLIKAGMQSGDYQIGNTNGSVVLDYDGTNLSIPAYKSTNTDGATINAIKFGMVGDGATDNTVTFSNLLKSGSAYLPDGVFVISNVVESSNPVKLTGLGTIKYVGDHTLTAVKLGGFSNKVDGITFDFGKTMGNSPSNGVALFVNPVGGSTVKRCTFRNIPNIGVLIQGDSDILARSNIWAVSENEFYRCAHGVKCAQTNMSEFGRVVNNSFYDFSGTGIFLGSANILCEGNEVCSYLGNVNNYASACGIWMEPATTGVNPNRLHVIVKGNHVAHCTTDLMCINQSIGAAQVEGNQFGGGANTIISNTVNLRVINNFFNPSTRVFLTNNTALTFAHNQVSGTIVGTNNGYMGYGNYNGSGNYFATDRVQAGTFQIENVGTFAAEGTDQFKITAWSGGYGTLKLANIYATTKFQIENAANLSYQGTANTVSYDAWSGGTGNALINLGGVSTTKTNTLIFSSVSSCTNTLPQGDGYASLSAGASVIIQDSFGNTIDTVGTVATIHVIIPLRKNYRLSGTSISCVMY